MRKFFSPKSVAIIGASSNKEKIGNILVQNLKQKKDLNLYPVNPKTGKIEGLKTFSTVLDIESSVDLAIIALPAKFVPNIVRECALKKKPIKNIIIISAGFSETGKEGEELENQIIGIAKEYNLKIAGPNCLGFLNVNENFNASFAKKEIKKGSIGLIMQSGALTTSLLDLNSYSALGFSLVSTLGNKIDIDETDLIDYYLKDNQTKIIAFYLEDIKRGIAFKKAIKKASLKKPVLIIKAGTSKLAQKAIQSHTGSMAKDSEITRLALEDAGVIYCESLYEFIACIKFINSFSLPKSDKLSIITNAGGPGVITTDLTQQTPGIFLDSFSDKSKRDLLKHLPKEASVENPIDILGDAKEDRYKNTIKAIKKINPSSSIAVIITPQSQTPIEKIATQLIDFNSKKDSPVIPVFMGEKASRLAEEVLAKEGISNFNFPFEMVTALRILNRHQRQKIFSIKNKESTINSNRKEKIQKITHKVKTEKRSALYYSESKKISDQYGLNVVKGGYINSTNQVDALKIKFPVVAKIDGEKFLHKNIRNAIETNIKNKSELKTVISRFKKSFTEERILIQLQQELGFEVIIGIKRDPDFGPILLIGLGGIFTEILNKKLLVALPKNQNQIKEQIKNSEIGKIINKMNLPLNDLVDQAFKVSKLAIENEEIKELDINPIFLYPNKKSKIVDIKILI